MASEITGLSNLCVHTITLKPWSIEQTAEALAANGIGGITVWRDALTGRNISSTGNRLRELGLNIISLCRGGFFPALNVKNRQTA
ncbi:MAG: sugar phosphate isomerase/epimerase, partial [Flavitalea sp.]